MYLVEKKPPFKELPSYFPSLHEVLNVTVSNREFPKTVHGLLQ